MSRDRSPAHVRRQNGDGRRRHAGNPQRVTERIRRDLPQPLDDFPRQAGYPLKREVLRNPAPLVLLRAFDLALLPTNISVVLDRRLKAGDVERPRHSRIEIERETLLAPDE